MWSRRTARPISISDLLRGRRMGLGRKAVTVVVIGIVLKYLLSLWTSPIPSPPFGGHVEPEFEAVERAFRKNFDDGFEPDGAAFAVCHRGKMVVDLWGGYADKMSGRAWKEDTMTGAFSTTKGVVALVMAILVDRGHIAYEDLVVKHWPEFGVHGKDNITVSMILTHQSGLAALDEPITFEMIKDWRKMSKALENQPPYWPPGTQLGYHALTYGWLCDQLVRRVDPQYRSLADYFRDEVAKRFDIDFYVGLPQDQFYRVARMTLPRPLDIIRRLNDWAFTKWMLEFLIGKSHPAMEKIMTNPSWLIVSGQNFPMNNPDIQELEIPAAIGIGTARGLAKLFCLLDGTELISKDTLSKISQPTIIDEKDILVKLALSWGYGFIFTKSPNGQYQLGHAGNGGQNVKFDANEHLAIGYLRSNMAMDMGDMSRTFRGLQDAVYESVNALKKKG